MSYGQPCRRTTGGPPPGPASTYPTRSRPALTYFNGAKEVADCACAVATRLSCVAATLAAAVPKNRPREWLGPVLVLIGEFPFLQKCLQFFYKCDDSSIHESIIASRAER